MPKKTSGLGMSLIRLIELKEQINGTLRRNQWILSSECAVTELDTIDGIPYN